MPNVVVIADKVAWREWDDKVRRYVGHYHARKDPSEGPTIVDMPEHEIARHDDLKLADPRSPSYGKPLVVREEDYEAFANVQRATVDPVWGETDEQLMSLTADNLIAKMNATPGLAERVLPLEQDRKYTRKAVVEHCERLSSASDGKDVSLADTPAELPASPLKSES